MMRPQLLQRSAPVSSRVLLAALFAALVIVGLLGMHTLSTAHSGLPGAGHSAGAAAVDAHSSHSASDSLDAHAAEPGCADCRSSESDHAAIMACVLGLLVTLLLICRAKPGLVSARGPSIVAPFVRAAVTPLPRPPSLAVLSISRR